MLTLLLSEIISLSGRVLIRRLFHNSQVLFIVIITVIVNTDSFVISFDLASLINWQNVTSWAEIGSRHLQVKYNTG